MFVCKDDELSLTTQCELIGISKSGLYYTPKGESADNLKLMTLMDEHHTLHPTHGILQMQDFLFARAIKIGRNSATTTHFTGAVWVICKY